MASARGVTAALLVMLCLAAATQPAIAAVDGKATLVKFVRKLQAAKAYNTFLALLGKSGLVPIIERYFEEGHRATFLIPSDKAFMQLPPATLSLLMKDKAKLQAVLLNHGLPQFQTFLQLAQKKTGYTFTTLDRQPLQRWAHVKYSTVAFGPPGAKSATQIGKIFHANLAISGPLIGHAIDHVLMPSTLPAA